MRKNIVWTVIGLLAVIGLAACGGGGGGGDATPTAAGTPINLSEVKNFSEARTPGSTISFNLAGSSSAGENITGSFSLSISAPTITSTPTGTQTVNVSVTNVTLTNTTTGAFASSLSTDYFYQTGLLYQTVNDDGTISTPISQTLLPSSAKVGDFGPDMVVSNADGSTDTTTWRIDAGTNGDAIFVFATTSRDSFNVVTSTDETALTIKPDGSISAMSVKLFIASSGITITLSGNRN